MDERFSLYDIAAALSERTGMEQPQAETFLKELIATVNDGIRTDHIVKVRGLGVFKIIVVKERESIHVNSGERILIPEHHKLTFVPEKDLKELVNKPFSAFEAELIMPDGQPDAGSLVTDMRYESDDTDDGDNEITDEETTLLPPPPPPLYGANIPETPLPPDEETMLLPPPSEENIPADDDTIVLPPPPPPPPAQQRDAPLESDEETVLITPAQPEVQPSHTFTQDACEDETVLLTAPEPPTPEQEIHVVEGDRKKKKSLLPYYIATIILCLIFCGTLAWFLFSGSGRPSEQVGGESFALPGDSAAQDTAAVTTDSTFVNQDSVKTSDTLPTVTTTTIPSTTTEPDKSSNSKPVMTPTRPSGATGSGSNNTAGGSNNKTIANVKMTTGQRLTLLALEYYGDKIFWVYIYEYNKSKIGANPNHVPVGMEIAIPDKSIYGIDANSTASREKARQRQNEIMNGLQ